MPGPDELRAVRTWLAENHAAFRKASRQPQKLLGKLEGSAVTRMPKGFAAGHPAEDLIRMKQWLYWVELDAKLATTPRLLPELVKRFRAAAPVIAMLNAPLRKTRQNRPALLPRSVLRLLVTLCTPPTPLAAMPATVFVHLRCATTPSSVTSPFLTMMWIGGTAPNW